MASVKKIKTPLPPLHEAVEARNEELVRNLVKTGCNDRDSTGRTPLHLVATRPLTHTLHSNNQCIKFVPMDEEEVQSRVRIANLLIDAGANVNSQSSSVAESTSYPMLKTPLQEAALCQNEAIVKLFLQHGADVNAKTEGKTGNTALHSAMTHFEGNTGLVKILLDHGADVNAVNRKGDTPLHLAVKHPAHCSAELIELFLKHGADINAKSRQTGDTALHLVMNRFQANTYLAKVSPMPTGDLCMDDTLLDSADMNLVKVLLEHGSDVSAVNRQGDTPLHLAVKNPTQCFVGLIKLFMEYGADINFKAQYTGNTVLHCAITHFQGNVDLMKILLEHSDVNTVNGLGETPLHLAAKNTTQCSVELIKLLLTHGADVNLKARLTGNTALHLAIPYFQENINFVKILLKHADVNAVNVRGETPLHLAVKSTNCSIELIELLLKHGADVDKKRKTDNDIAFQLYIAAHLPSSVDPRILKLLLLGNNRKEDDRMSPLHDACLFHRVESVRELLRAGADPVAKDSFGNIPMFYALVSHQPTKMDDKRSTIRLMMDFSVDLDQKCIFLTIGHDNEGWAKVGGNDATFINIFYNYAIQRMELSNGVDGKILQKFVIPPCHRSSKNYDFWLNMSRWYNEYYYRRLSMARRFVTHESEFVVELQLMKNTKVGRSEISFLDLLEGISEQKVMTAYVRNCKQLTKDFGAGRSKFKRYRSILEAMFYKNYNECRTLIKSGAEALSIGLGFGYSLELYLRKYLCHYSKEELKRLIE